jgi:hypothetical protein
MRLAHPSTVLAAADVSIGVAACKESPAAITDCHVLSIAREGGAERALTPTELLHERALVFHGLEVRCARAGGGVTHGVCLWCGISNTRAVPRTGILSR